MDKVHHHDVKLQPLPVCLWCRQGFAPRRTGGSPQRFCTRTCRHNFHTAARRWISTAVDHGRLAIEDLKKAPEAPAAACTLARGASEASKVSGVSKASEASEASKASKASKVSSPPERA